MSKFDVQKYDVAHLPGRKIDPKWIMDQFIAQQKMLGNNLEFRPSINVNRVMKDGMREKLEKISVFRIFLDNHSETEVRGRPFGYISGWYRISERRLHIIDVKGKSDDLYKVEELYKPRGIGTALIAFLMHTYPDVELVSMSLGYDSDRQYLKAVEEGREHYDAIMSTDLCRILAKYGFVIDKENTDKEKGEWILKVRLKREISKKAVNLD